MSFNLTSCKLTAYSALIAAAFACQTGVALGQDPRIGSWTLVSAQSSLDPANTLSITPAKDGVHVVMGGETRLDFTAKANGQDSAVPGNPGFNQIEMRKAGKNLIEVTEKKNGAVVATLHNRISPDKRELTTTTSSAGRADQITVWTRTGGAKSATDPLVGEWTQDLGKTRMRQGLVLKIEPEGGNGVRFTGDYSYTAHFDGKPYDLKGSRNDTVALAMVDPHTVDATYRRDNQVTQKDTWVVSADGRTMTMTGTGTYETGQRMTEKLVFQKQ
jgi:hypothetical protein